MGRRLLRTPGTHTNASTTKGGSWDIYALLLIPIQEAAPRTSPCHRRQARKDLSRDFHGNLVGKLSPRWAGSAGIVDGPPVVLLQHENTCWWYYLRLALLAGQLPKNLIWVLFDILVRLWHKPYFPISTNRVAILYVQSSHHSSWNIFIKRQQRPLCHKLILFIISSNVPHF